MEKLSKEIAALQEWFDHTKYGNLCDLKSEEEAIDMICFFTSRCYKLPKRLHNPKTMMAVWNHVVQELRATLDQDSKIIAEHPDWIRVFNKKTRRTLWYDPAQISEALSKVGYDAESIEVMFNSMRYYAKI